MIELSTCNVNWADCEFAMDMADLPFDLCSEQFPLRCCNTYIDELKEKRMKRLNENRTLFIESVRINYETILRELIKKIELFFDYYNDIPQDETPNDRVTYSYEFVSNNYLDVTLVTCEKIKLFMKGHNYYCQYNVDKFEKGASNGMNRYQCVIEVFVDHDYYYYVDNLDDESPFEPEFPFEPKEEH